MEPIRGSSLIQGRTTSCGCFRLEQIARKSRKDGHKALYMQLFISYKANARGRNREFKLSLEEFCAFLAEACYFCGRRNVNCKKSDWDTLYYNGIDRVNNEIGYRLENCVPCCGPCNILKGGLTKLDFINLIQLITKNLGAKDWA